MESFLFLRFRQETKFWNFEKTLSRKGWWLVGTWEKSKRCQKKKSRNKNLSHSCLQMSKWQRRKTFYLSIPTPQFVRDSSCHCSFVSLIIKRIKRISLCVRRIFLIFWYDIRRIFNDELSNFWKLWNCIFSSYFAFVCSFNWWQIDSETTYILA